MRPQCQVPRWMMPCINLNKLLGCRLSFRFCSPPFFVPGTPVQVDLSARLFLIPVLDLPNSHRGKVRVKAKKNACVRISCALRHSRTPSTATFESTCRLMPSGGSRSPIHWSARFARCQVPLPSLNPSKPFTDFGARFFESLRLHSNSSNVKRRMMGPSNQPWQIYVQAGKHFAF